MNFQPEQVVIHWLKQLKIPVAPSYIKEKLLSHPDYPSLVSITDTLDELNIENGAFVVEKEKLNEIPVPFLAHTTTKGGVFELITDIGKHLKYHPHFEKEWDGIAIVAEKPEYFGNRENEKLLQQGKRKHRMSWLFMLFISGFFLFFIANNFSWQYTGLLLTTLAGFSVAILIIQHELGINNEFTEHLCAAGKNTDCDAVMKSKRSKLLQWFNWADAGIIYFSSVFFLLAIFSATEVVQAFEIIFALLATCTLPFTFVSVFYQWRVVKKWCPLCLTTVVLLWIQFGLLLPELPRFLSETISLNAALFTLFSFFIITVVWISLIKPALQKNKELSDKNFSLSRFKNNPEIFNALLQQQRGISTTPFEDDLQFGNPDADLQIMVACNPYCGPCAGAHKELDGLLEKNNIGLTVRFAINTEKKDDKRFLAAQYLLQSAKDKPGIYKRKLLHDWYANMDFEKFSRKYFLDSDADVEDLLKQHEQWCEESRITFTPTIFINGKELPRKYGAEDLKTIFRAGEKPGNIKPQLPVDESELIPV